MNKILLVLALSWGLMSAAHAEGNYSSSSASEANCNTAIDRCTSLPTPKPCPAGTEWSLMGSGIAHCVAKTPICPTGTKLSLDSLGNPSCVANPPPTCPANSTWDGSNCIKNPPTACPNGTTWDGSTCGPNPPPTCPTGSNWDGSTCVSAPPATCPSGTAWNGTSCVAAPATCANGATDYPTCTAAICANGATNYPTCSFPPPVCANGATNYPICSFPPPICANGATNYPICTLPIKTKPKFYCFGDNAGAAAGVTDGTVGTYGAFYPYDPNINYVGISNQEAISGGWYMVPLGQYAEYAGYPDNVQLVWCTGSNGN